MTWWKPNTWSKRAVTGAAVIEQQFALIGGNANTPRRGTAELIQLYNTSPPFRRVVSLIADQIAALKWEVYPAGVDESEPLIDHPLTRLMTQPNPSMFGNDMMRLLQVWLEIKDEAFLLIALDGLGVPAELTPLPPHWITETPKPGKDFFKVNGPEGFRMHVPPENMIWLRSPNPADPFARPSGFGDALSDELDTDEAAAKYGKAFFRNSAKPDAIAAVSNVKNEAQLQQAKDMWNAENQGVSKAHRVHWMSGDIKVHELSKSAKDAQLLELRKHTDSVVRQMYGVPPEVLGELANSNRATITQALRILATRIVIPRGNRLKQMLDARLCSLYKKRPVELCFESPLPADKDFALEVSKTHPHAFTVDEIRAMAEHAPLPEGAGEVFVADGSKFAVLAPAEIGAMSDEPQSGVIDGKQLGSSGVRLLRGRSG